MIMLYAIGTAASARRRFATLRQLLTHRIVSDRRTWLACELVNPFAVVDVQMARRLPGLDRRKTPINDRLAELIRPWLRLPVPDDDRYERSFDEFEYLLGLSCLDAPQAGWAPPGRFAWKHGGELDPGTRLAAEVETRGSGAEFLAAGLFGGSVDRFGELRTAYSTQLHQSGVAW